MRAATATSTRPLTVCTGSKRVGVDEREVLGLDAVHRRARRGATAAASRSPAATAPRAARSARDEGDGAARARRRSRRTLRLDSARPSGSRTVGITLELDREVEVAHHAAQDGDLLGVLLAEVGDVGRDHVEAASPRRCRRRRSGPGRARRPRARRTGPRRGRVVAKPVRVDLLDGGREQHVDAELLGDRGVALPRRAGRRRGRAASLNCAGLTNSETTTSSQRSRAARISDVVAGVEGAHRRDEADRAARAARRATCARSSGDGADRPHARHRVARGWRPRARRTAASRSGARSSIAARWRATVGLVAAGDRGR